MKRKQIVLGAITLVIVGLLMTSAASMAIHKSSVKENISAANAVENTNSAQLSTNRKMAMITELDGKEVQSISIKGASDAQKLSKQAQKLELNTREVTGVMQHDNQYEHLHPAIAADGDYISYAFEYYNDTGEETNQGCYWQGSDDGGETWGVSRAWGADILDTASYPTIGFWGYNVTEPTIPHFYGSMVCPNTFISGGPNLLVRVDGNPGINYSYSCWYWNWGDDGWHDMKDADIAVDGSLGGFNWGYQAFVHTNDDHTNGPNVFYQMNDTGGGTIQYWPNVSDCNVVDTSIDPISQDAYTVWDYYLDEEGYYASGLLIIRQDWSNEMEYIPEEDFALYLFDDGEGGYLNVSNPVVDVYDNKLVILAEVEYEPGDTDIWCWHKELEGAETRINLSTMYLSTVAYTTYNDGNPELAHQDGETFESTWTIDDTGTPEVQNIKTKTNNAGENWGEWWYVYPDDEAIYEYGTMSVSDNAQLVMWEYDTSVNIGGSDYDAILLHFMNLTFPDNAEPYKPVALAPEDGEVDLDHENINSIWWSGGDPDGDSVTYEVFLDDFSPPVTLRNTTDFTGQYDVCAVGVSEIEFDPETTYYWQVVAEDTLLQTNTSDIFSFTTAPAGPTCVCGDANGDGSVNVGDAVYIINYVFKGGPAPVPLPCCGDANNDGSVNVGDAVYLINYVFKGGPAPGPNCCP